MQLRITWQYLVTFAALTILCGTSHEFVHHFAAAGICGEFGLKTFNSFSLAPSCAATPVTLWATVAGPLFTFGLMWWGMFMLRHPDERRRQLGFALIFANFPINRMVFVLMGWNDEQWTAKQLVGNDPAGYWIAVILVWAACVPPLVAAYRAIGNRWRPAWFAAFFVLPFVFVLLFAGMFLENYLLLKLGFLDTPVLGIPLLILLVEILSLLVYYSFKPWISGERNSRAPMLAAGTAA